MRGAPSHGGLPGGDGERLVDGSVTNVGHQDGDLTGRDIRDTVRAISLGIGDKVRPTHADLSIAGVLSRGRVLNPALDRTRAGLREGRGHSHHPAEGQDDSESKPVSLGVVLHDVFGV